MNGAYTAADSTPIKPVDLAINILGMAVAGWIEQYCLENPVTCLVDGSASGCRSARKVGGLKGMFKVSATGAAYELRVLQGIWAAAPYLHKAVPTLAQLLTPAAQPGEDVRGRIELRPGQYRARDHAEPVQLCYPATGCGN